MLSIHYRIPSQQHACSVNKYSSVHFSIGVVYTCTLNYTCSPAARWLCPLTRQKHSSFRKGRVLRTQATPARGTRALLKSGNSLPRNFLSRIHRSLDRFTITVVIPMSSHLFPWKQCLGSALHLANFGRN